MIGPIKTVAVYVNNQQSAKAFYIEKLGFTLRRELPMGPETSWIEVSPAGSETAIVIYPKAMMEDWAEKKTFHRLSLSRCG